MKEYHVEFRQDGVLMMRNFKNDLDAALTFANEVESGRIVMINNDGIYPVSTEDRGAR